MYVHREEKRAFIMSFVTYKHKASSAHAQSHLRKGNLSVFTKLFTPTSNFVNYADCVNAVPTLCLNNFIIIHTKRTKFCTYTI